jgi:hypothetical protein
LSSSKGVDQFLFIDDKCSGDKDEHSVACATRSWHATYYMLAYEGSIALLQGRWEDAERSSAALLDQGGEDADAFNIWAAQQGILHRERGTFDLFRPAMELAVEESPRLVGFRAAIALAHSGAGRPGAGREQLSRSPCPPCPTWRATSCGR